MFTARMISPVRVYQNDRASSANYTLIITTQPGRETLALGPDNVDQDEA